MGQYLGQHFLKSEEVVRDIIASADLAVAPPKGGTTADTVIEVGPGKGVLTQALLNAGAHVIAVEKDTRFIAPLKQKFPSAQIIEGDILDIDHWKLIENCKLKIENFKVVANIPYYITGEILRKFLTALHQPERIVLLVQKEVAERIVGSTSLTTSGKTKESILSLSVKTYGTPSIVRYVSRADFDPPPDVDSAVLLIEKISRNFFKDVDEEKFFDLIKKGFAHKRKKLSNNIALSGPAAKLMKNKRAEELSLTDWRELYQKLFN